MSRVFRLIAVLSCALALSTVSRAQSLSWDAYNTSGNLVGAAVGTGGDLIGGNTVSLTVPAGQTLIFVTQNFVPRFLIRKKRWKICSGDRSTPFPIRMASRMYGYAS